MRHVLFDEFIEYRVESRLIEPPEHRYPKRIRKTPTSMIRTATKTRAILGRSVASTNNPTASHSVRTIQNGHQPTFRYFSAASVDDASPPNIMLYQYAICPFCHRVKAVLDFAGVDYETTEVNPLTKAEIKPWKDHHNKVPIATVQAANTLDEPSPLFESASIVQGLLKQPAIQKRLTDRWQGSSMTLDDFQSGPRVQKWIDFAVNDLASLLYPNMCRTWGDSYRAFNYVHTTDTFGPLQRIMIQSIGSLAMFMAASKVKKKRSITDEVKALEDVLSLLEAELGNKPFLSGREQPDLGDLTVFGTLRAIEGLPVHNKLVLQRGGPFVAWYETMKMQVAP